MEEELEEKKRDIWMKFFSLTPSFQQYRDY